MTGLVVGMIGVGAIAWGIYVMYEAESRISGVTIFVVALLPAALFLSIAWVLLYFAKTGRYPPQTPKIKAVMKRLGDPVWRSKRP